MKSDICLFLVVFEHDGQACLEDSTAAILVDGLSSTLWQQGLILSGSKASGSWPGEGVVKGQGLESSKCGNSNKRTQTLVHIKSRIFLSVRDEIPLPGVQLLNLLSVQFGAPFTSQVNLY